MGEENPCKAANTAKESKAENRRRCQLIGAVVFAGARARVVLSTRSLGIHGHSNTFSTTEQVLLGLNFSDLLVRLFLRVAKQSRLTELPYPEILAEQTPELGQRDNVLFFGGVLKNVHVRRQEPIDFAVELSRRWEAACPTVVALPSNARQRKDGVPKGSIFISYARENESEARALCEALKEQGCAVWYDRERLRPGGYLPDDLQDAVKRDCGIFISLISETTETEEEGYWRRERDWTIEL